MGAKEYYESDLFLEDLARDYLLDEALSDDSLPPELRQQIEEVDGDFATTEGIDLWDSLFAFFEERDAVPARSAPAKSPRQTERFSWRETGGVSVPHRPGEGRA